MATKQDWIKDTDWFEAHLTPRGWRYGTEIRDTGYKLPKEPPTDRLMTVRCFECTPANPNRAPQEWSEIHWRTNNVEALEKAQDRWGVLPGSAPALSTASAADHLDLKNIRSMRLSKDRRPEYSALSLASAPRRAPQRRLGRRP
jgi:hypothetical protein